MNEDFYDFIKEPSKANFLRSRAVVINDPEYNPYSEDIDEMEDLLEENKFEAVIAYNNINVLLSPSAHLLKSYALDRLGKEKEAQYEAMFGYKIIENMMLTGTGSKEEPYIILRISDEMDLLFRMHEEFRSQSLVYEGDKKYDRIVTQSGKEIFFDITACYGRISDSSVDRFLAKKGETKKTTEVHQNKKWWKFW